MASCEYGQIVGGTCGPSVDNPANVKSVMLAKCKKPIQGHLRAYNVRDAGLDSESKLLLARAGIFDISEGHLELTICPRHRDKLGIRWRSNKTNCTAPSEWSSHGKSVSGERGISLRHSKLLHQQSQVLLPVGSQICKQCRRKLEKVASLVTLSTPFSASESVEDPDDVGAQEVISEDIVQREDEDSQEDVLQLVDSILHLAIDDESLTQPDDQLDDSLHHSSLENVSLYEPDCQASSSETSSGNESPKSSQATKRSLLNDFLRSCDADTIGPHKRRWELSSVRTRANHVSKAKSLIVAGLNVIAPGDASYLWEAVRKSGSVEKELGIGEQHEEQKYLEALTESYRNASSWETRRQILSIMGDQTSFKRLQSYIPGLTEYRFKIARQHSLHYGRGAEIPRVRSPRMRVERPPVWSAVPPPLLWGDTRDSKCHQDDDSQ
ncbi:uncharacterized protein [Montipora foliosa]|uniref:uncharacterized protein n=1 Tax=Montipora foliosa TaxID=591990 RepID=UPI0035F164E6